MARPRSEDKRNAILEAATRVIAVEGVSAPTAKIAKLARVAVALDVTDSAGARAAVEVALEAFGRVDVLGGPAAVSPRTDNGGMWSCRSSPAD